METSEKAAQQAKKPATVDKTNSDCCSNCTNKKNSYEDECGKRHRIEELLDSKKEKVKSPLV